MGNGQSENGSGMDKSICSNYIWDSEMMLEGECVSDALHTCVFHNDQVTMTMVYCPTHKKWWFYIEAPWQSLIVFDMD